MKLICALIALLISSTFCDIYLGRNDKITFDPNVEPTRYFYIKLEEFKSFDKVYFTIGINHGELSSMVNYAFFNPNYNESDINLQSLYSTGHSGTASTHTYYFKLDYKDYAYLFVNYKINMRYSNSRITIQTYDSDPFNFFWIILISVFGGIILIIIIIIVYKYKKRSMLSMKNRGGIPPINTIQQGPIIPPPYPQYPQQYGYQ